jgi:hypothetical protein
MAIDTRRKRVAAASTRLRFLRRVWIVEPDSTLDASDRARLGGAFQATPQNVALLSLATTSTVHELSVDIPLSVVNTTSTVHSPSVAAVVALNTTNTTSTVHSPSVAVTVALNTVTTSSNVYSHEVVSTVGLESLSTTSTVFSHRVVAVLPGSHMGIELRVLDLAGTVEALLPRYEETAFEDALNEVGSGSLVIAKSDDFLATTVGSELIGAEAKIISVMVDGQERGRWIVEDIQEAFTQDDIPVFVLSGRGLASQLEWGTVIPTTYNPPTNVISLPLRLCRCSRVCLILRTLVAPPVSCRSVSLMQRTLIRCRGLIRRTLRFSRVATCCRSCRTWLRCRRATGMSVSMGRST